MASIPSLQTLDDKPVGWSSKTVELIYILKQNNPYTILPTTIKTKLESLRKLPELQDYQLLFTPTHSMNHN